MKLTLYGYGTSEHHELVRNIVCKSFEFRTNHCENWIKVKYEDGNSELIHDIATIKAEEGEE